MLFKQIETNLIFLRMRATYLSIKLVKNTVGMIIISYIEQKNWSRVGTKYFELPSFCYFRMSTKNVYYII